MVKLCRFPEKDCHNSFISYIKNKTYCRLTEWKHKKGQCPYDSKITSLGFQMARINKKKVGQTSLFLDPDNTEGIND
jgi:hypothetical protein